MGHNIAMQNPAKHDGLLFLAARHSAMHLPLMCLTRRTRCAFVANS